MIEVVEKRKQSEIGLWPEVCRKTWWLSGELQAYLVDIAKNGIKLQA